ncbi:Chromosome partition protein Smc [uncultured archaeon]|nr:Chromosome partition protein Smc [uncultured archaeon]
MKHNVNYVLFGLLLVTLMMMVILSLYYRITYERLNDRYTEARQNALNVAGNLSTTLTDVQAKEAALNEREKELLDIINQLNISKTREQSLGNYYTDVQSKTETLQLMLNQTSRERDMYIKKSQDATTELTMCQAEYGVVSRRFEQVNSSLNEVKQLSSDLARDVSSLQAGYDEASDNVGIGYDRLLESLDTASDMRSQYPACSGAIQNITSPLSDVKTRFNKVNTGLDNMARYMNLSVAEARELKQAVST